MNISQMNCQQNIKKNYYATFQANMKGMTQSALTDAIKKAPDIDTLRKLSPKLKNMPSEVHNLYFEKYRELNDKLTPAQKSITNCWGTFVGDTISGDWVPNWKLRRDAQRAADNRAKADAEIAERTRREAREAAEYLETDKIHGYADR